MTETPKGLNIGYGRVSTSDQNPDSQRDALSAAGCDAVHIDVMSGKAASRPELDKVLTKLRAGDTLTVTRLDRLGRSVKNLAELSDRLRALDVDLVVLEQGIDTRTSAGRFFYNVLAAMGEFERDLIQDRTNEGLAAARARGRVGGRKKKLNGGQSSAVRAMYAETGADGKRKHTVADIARSFGISRPTVYRYLKEGSV